MSNNLQQNLDVVQTRLMGLIEQAKAQLLTRPEFASAPRPLQESLLRQDGPPFVEALLAARLEGIDDLVAQLKRIDAALCQLDLGLYGLCSDCEDPIEVELLEADPCHQRCSRCDGRHQRHNYSSRLML